MKIPKIIHQIWIGSNKQPIIWTDTFSKDYIKMYQEWTYKLWNDNNIIELFEGFPLYKKVYDLERQYCGKADILRYIILYKYGGIYIDADSVWVNNKSLDYLIENVNNTGVFVAYEDDVSKKVCNGVMGSTINNKLMLKLINGIENIISWRESTYNRMQYKTGVTSRVGPKYIQRQFVNENVTIYPSIFFYPISWHGVVNIDNHTKMDLPPESFMFQYGYTTNNLSTKFFKL